MVAVYIYSDEGAGKGSLLQTSHSLKEILPSNYQIKTIKAKEIIGNEWIKDAVLLVMPGDADLPYAKKLNGAGNHNIKNYVKNGGAYLGICAGSYYGANYVEFDKGGELEVLGNRELAFFPGKAIGPNLAKYDYKNDSGARAAIIKLELANVTESTIYYNGGGYFENAADYKNVSVLGYYKDHLPAIIYISYGKGNVILSGVHFEYDTSLFDLNNPYLSKISPDLKRADATRKVLIKEILKKLGLNIRI